MGSSLPNIHLKANPERLVGLGFRCAMTSLRPGSNCAAPQSCALLKTSIEAHHLPAKLNSDFAAWALAVEATAERAIELAALEHPSFSPDESLAIALVAACQHAHCPALIACASALLGSYDLGRALAATQILAHTLFTANAVLNAASTSWRLDQSNPTPRLH